MTSTVATAQVQQSKPEPPAELQQCQAQVADCEDLIRRADLLIGYQAEVINTQDRQMQEMEQMLEAQKQELSKPQAWYNSKGLWFAIGVLTGVVTLSF